MCCAVHTSNTDIDDIARVSYARVLPPTAAGGVQTIGLIFYLPEGRGSNGVEEYMLEYSSIGLEFAVGIRRRRPIKADGVCGPLSNVGSHFFRM